MARLLEYFAPVFSLGLAIDGQIAADALHGHADDQARQLIEQARSDARAAGKAPPAVESAAFAAVAWFDEVIARNPFWRGANSPLQALLFSTHGASEEFFEHLTNLTGADGEVREVYYHALLLGFVGPYYFEAGDHGELGKIKQLISLQLPVAPLSPSALRKERLTPQPYLIDDPSGPRYPNWRDVWRMKMRALVKRIATHSARDRSALRQGRHDDEPETQTQMSEGIRQAKHTISHAPELAGRQPLYRVPWLLFLGDVDANVSGLMEAASTSSPFPAPAEDSETMWRWWLSPSMVAIETRPSIVCDTSAFAERGLWCRALTLLASERSRLPLNGIVVCIGARSLLNGTDGLKETSLRLRRLVDESMQRLQLPLPLYVLVTGLELLPGYATFCAAIPSEIFAQALGWRLPERSTAGAGTTATFDSHFSSMMERLYALRLALLAAEQRLPGRRGLFEFVQSIAGMQNQLRQLVESLQESDATQRTPLWRGLYFVGAADPTAPGGSFVADPFARFLPADQPLATLGAKTSLATLR